jgi:hypothetical protein
MVASLALMKHPFPLLLLMLVTGCESQIQPSSNDDPDEPWREYSKFTIVLGDIRTSMHLFSYNGAQTTKDTADAAITVAFNEEYLDTNLWWRYDSLQRIGVSSYDSYSESWSGRVGNYFNDAMLTFERNSDSSYKLIIAVRHDTNLYEMSSHQGKSESRSQELAAVLTPVHIEGGSDSLILSWSGATLESALDSLWYSRQDFDYSSGSSQTTISLLPQLPASSITIRLYK